MSAGVVIGTPAERAILRERFDARAVRLSDTLRGVWVDALVLRLDTRARGGVRPMWIFMGYERDLLLPFQLTIRERRPCVS